VLGIGHDRVQGRPGISSVLPWQISHQAPSAQPRAVHGPMPRTHR